MKTYLIAFCEDAENTMISVVEENRHRAMYQAVQDYLEESIDSGCMSDEDADNLLVSVTKDGIYWPEIAKLLNEKGIYTSYPFKVE